jgi:penicillin-binding protein 1B
LKALIGGRSYGASQLNRSLAKRQPGSIFKPFVYAAALGTGLQSSGEVLTTVSTVVDEPTTFWFDGRSYEPNNFGGDFFGTVTMRQAITKSLNVPTVKFAEKAGFENVVAIARAAGLNANIKPTPAVALGSYEVTPLEIADAYTVWANEGEWVKLNYIRQIRSQAGGSIFEAKPEHKAALDPRVAYIVRSLMEEVLRSGTGAGARSRGFLLPAAGKTGTSHDAWFAGFTTKVLCVVWVGFDDNQELPLEGAKAALPIWVEFMKRAHAHREYRGAQPFNVVDGIVTVDIDPATGQLASGACPGARPEVFIAGTEPTQLCRLHGGGRTQIAGWETTEPEVREGAKPTVRPADPGSRPARRARKSVAQTTPEEAKPKEEPKRGFWDRIRGIFR